jgi:hypothetical protein
MADGTAQQCGRVGSRHIHLNPDCLQLGFFISIRPHIMRIFKNTLSFLLLITSCLATRAQTDSTEIDDDTDTSTQIVQLNHIAVRKRGIYKTYEEYLNNSPSVEAEFTVKPLQISRNNSLIAEGDVDYKGKRPKKIWGISDGQYVYVRVAVGQFFKNHYFRLQCDGPAPYIFYVEKPVFLAPGLGMAAMAAVAATSASLPPFVSLMVVRESTNYLKPVLLATNKRLKNYLKAYPDLLEAYQNEPSHNKATRAKYLTDYNNRKLRH